MSVQSNKLINQCIDKQAIEQIIGCLMQNPDLLKQDIRLLKEDFVETFYEIIFVTICKLYEDGAKKIDPDMIDKTILNSQEFNYRKYKEEDGKEYLIGAYRRADVENFNYYYKVVKKFTLLRELINNGFSIKEFFSPKDTDPELIQEKREKLDSYSINDLILHYRSKLSILDDKFGINNEEDRIKAGEGMIENIEKWKKGVLYGIPYASEYFTDVTHGLNKGRFTLLSAGTGVGKTRISVANICHSFVPYFYDSDEKKWVQNPYVIMENNEAKSGVLYIGTEMELKTEVNPIFSAYISDVPQEHIMEGKYEAGEEERVKIASIILKYHSRIYMENQPEYNIEKIERLIQKYSKPPFNIKHIFLDYVFTNPELIKEYTIKSQSRVTVREDQVLLNLSTKLKDFSRKYKVSIDTWTQTNSEYKNENNRDTSVIRGAKSIADKVDVGGVVSIPTEKEMTNLKKIRDEYIRDNGIFIEKNNTDKYTPNVCLSVYKNRGGKYKDIKIWLRIDYSTMRVHDLYVTNNKVTDIVKDLKKKRYIFLDKNNNSTHIRDEKEILFDMPEDFYKSLQGKIKEEVDLYYQELEEAKDIMKDEDFDF